MIGLEALFLTYLRTSFFGSVMILAVLLLRPLLRKAPRNICCILWLLVAVRLLLPFQLESQLSLQPRPMTDAVSITEVAPEPSPVTDVQPPVTVDQPEADGQPPLSRNGIPKAVLAVIWTAGGLGMIIYAAVSLAKLRKRVWDAIRCPDGVWESDRIADAFLLGYWKPRIYLPIRLNQRDRELIIRHERAHQSRKDQWWKLLGLVCLSIHWFNPLVWLGYVLMCRDIETACDEKVIEDLTLSQRKEYSLALLNRGKRLSGLLSYSVAFGEVNLKHRIQGVLNYRKPGLWVTCGAVTVAVTIAVCFMTNPVDQQNCVHEFDSVVTVQASCLKAGVRTDTCKRCDYSRTEEVPAISHRYDAGTVIQEASCTAEGKRTHTCTLCNEHKTEAIPMLEHAYDEGTQTQAPTCSEKGIVTYTCKTCGYLHTEETDTLPHTFGEKTVTKSPTCISEGEICVSCTVCGHQEPVETIPKSQDHNYENKVIRKPTCVDPGMGQEVCTLCGHSVDCDYQLTDHSYGEAVVTKQATCTAKGERTYTCSVCNDVKTETVSKKDHTWNDAECNTSMVCTVCGKKGSVQEHDYVVIDHSFAFPNSLSTKTYKCLRCDTTKTTYFGHNGPYDMDALEKAGVAYAQKLGFITNPCPGHGTYSVVTRDPYYSVASLNGGQKWLEDMLFSMIDEVDRWCEDNTQYYVEIVADYVFSFMTKEGSYFELEVYYHHCTQGE